MSQALPFLASRRAFRSPLSLAGLEAWYDVRDPASMVVDSANRVSLIADKSGKSNTNCLCLNGAAGNYASTPDSAALSITGDIDIRVHVALNDWTGTADTQLISKWEATGNQRAYNLHVRTTGVLRLEASTTGSDGGVFTSTASVPFSDLSAGWVRVTLDVDNGAAGRTATFYTSTDGLTWSQLGDPVVVATAANTFDSTAALYIGEIFSGGTESRLLSGRIYRAQIYNGIAGTLVFDANFTAQNKLATSFTESSANAATVTINTSGDTGARICGERDLVQMTASKQPVYLSYSGEPYFYFRGTAGEPLSGPDSAALDALTGDIDVRLKIAAADYTPATSQTLLGKVGDATNQSWVMRLHADGTLTLYWSPDGTTGGLLNAVSTANLAALAAFEERWVRATLDVDNGAGGNTTTFYTSSDGVTWTQLGAAVVKVGTTSIFASNATIRLGDSASLAFAGKCFHASVRNGIDGAVVWACDASNHITGSTLVDSSVNAATITINGATAVVRRAGLYFDGSDDYLKAAAFSLSQPETVEMVGRQVSWATGDILYDGNGSSNRMSIFQNTSSPNLTIYAGASPANNGNLAVGIDAVLSAVFNDAASSIRVNRGPATTGTGGTQNANGFTLGASSVAGNATNMGASEIAIYNRALSTAEQDRFALYAARKWRLSL